MSRHRTTLFALSSLALASLSACTVAQETEQTGTDESAIRNGTVTRDYPAVGMLGIHGDKWTCTATLLDSTTIITAAHCAFSDAPHAPETPVQLSMVLRAPDFTFYPNTSKSGLRSTSGGIKVRTMIAFGDGDHQSDDNPDIALMKLEKPVALGSYPTLATSLPTSNETWTAVGFGCEDDDTGFWTKRMKTIEWRVPAAISQIYLGRVGSQQGLLSRTGNGVVCPGDSGGPLFRPGANEIVGIAYAGSASRSLWGNVPAIAAGKTLVDYKGKEHRFPSRIESGREALSEGTPVCNQGSGAWCADGWGRVPGNYATTKSGSVTSLMLAECNADKELVKTTHCLCVREQNGTADHCKE